MRCDCCIEKATLKDFRTRYGCTSKYFVCRKHFYMGDLNFFKALNRKELVV